MTNPCSVHATSTTSRWRNRRRTTSASNRPHNSTVIATHEPGCRQHLHRRRQTGPVHPGEPADDGIIDHRDRHGRAPQLTGEDHHRQRHQHHGGGHPSDPGGLQRMRQRRWPPGRAPPPRRAPKRTERSRAGRVTAAGWSPRSSIGLPTLGSDRRGPAGSRAPHFDAAEEGSPGPGSRPPTRCSVVSPTAIFLLPNNVNPPTSTWAPSGTSTSMFPNGATALMTTSPGGNVACRRSRSMSPNNATGDVAASGAATSRSG